MKGSTLGLPAICLGALIVSAGVAEGQGRFDRRCEPLPLTILNDEACPVALETHKKKGTRICLGESRYEVFVANRSGRTGRAATVTARGGTAVASRCSLARPIVPVR